MISVSSMSAILPIIAEDGYGLARLSACPDGPQTWLRSLSRVNADTVDQNLKEACTKRVIEVSKEQIFMLL